MTEPVGSGPRAFFVCLSKKCRTDEGAPTYELPVSATHCPHGHKRLQRVWSGPDSVPGLVRSGSRDMQKVIDAAGSEALDGQAHRRDAVLRDEKNARELQAIGLKAGIQMVPIGQLAAGSGMSTGQGKALAAPPALVRDTGAAGRPVPAKVQARYRPTDADTRKAAE